jgi:uncharacterized phage protein (TIGR02220 family)
MNGFEQIKSFYQWVFNNPDKIRPTHISLYLFLWNQANRANWAYWFKCPYDLAMQGACIGNNKTYYKCLDELKEWKLIEYQKGINNFRAPLIHLVQLYDSAQLTEQVSVPQSAQQSAQQSVQLPAQQSAHIYKLITNNIKPITENIEEILLFLENKEKIKNNLNDITKSVIAHLNLKCKSSYKHTTQKTRDCISARLNEGFTEEDFKKVIDVKSDQWLNNIEMKGFLRPETLFGNKFEGYLNEYIVKPIQKKYATYEDMEVGNAGE